MTHSVQARQTLTQRLYKLVFSHALTTVLAPRRRPLSIFIRVVDAGSCNDTELEIACLANPVYDMERFGLQIVASPRHADVLLISGPLVRSMARATVEAFLAMPSPHHIVTAGDGFLPAGMWADSYATVPLVEGLTQAWLDLNSRSSPDGRSLRDGADAFRKELEDAWIVHIPGDPPAAQHILNVLLALWIG